MEYCFVGNYYHDHVFDDHLSDIRFGVATEMVRRSTGTSRRRQVAFDAIDDSIVRCVQKHVAEAPDIRVLNYNKTKFLVVQRIHNTFNCYTSGVA